MINTLFACVFFLITVPQAKAVFPYIFSDSNRMSDEEVIRRQELHDVMVSRLNTLSPLVAEALKTAGAAEPKGELGTHFYENGDWRLYENNNNDERILEFMAYQVAVKLQRERVDRNKTRIILGGTLSYMFGWIGYMVSKGPVQSEQEQAESEWNALAFLGGSVALPVLGIVWLHRHPTEETLGLDVRTVQLLCKNNKSNAVRRMIELLGHGSVDGKGRQYVMQQELERQDVLNV